MTISEDSIDVSTRRLGLVRIPVVEIEEIVFDDGEKAAIGIGKAGRAMGGISMLVLKLRFGCAVALPPSLANQRREIQASDFSQILLLIV